MTNRRRVQLPRADGGAGCVAVGAVLGAAVWWCGRPLLDPAGTDVTRLEIRESARLPVLFWCLGWPTAAWAWPRDSAAGRTLWAVGCLFLWLHIAIAFHLGHGWSHRAAWEHTRAVGGYGDGVFVNYAFALVWLADAIWARVARGSYRTRPRWLHRAVHGFLAFVVFNAAVVFAGWGIRVTFLFALLTPPALRCLCGCGPRPVAPTAPGGSDRTAGRR
jgi:hypothetical protein